MLKLRTLAIVQHRAGIRWSKIELSEVGPLREAAARRLLLVL